MFVLGHASAYEDAHLSQSISHGFLLIHHAFLSIHQAVHRNRVRLLPKAHEAKGGVIRIDCNRIFVDKSAITAKNVSAEQSVHFLDHTNRDTRSFQYLLAYFLGLIGHEQAFCHSLRRNGS